MMYTFGGVARNVAECMTRLGTPPFFISAVGSDRSGNLITSYLEKSAMVIQTHTLYTRVMKEAYLDTVNTYPN